MFLLLIYSQERERAPETSIELEETLHSVSPTADQFKSLQPATEPDGVG